MSMTNDELNTYIATKWPDNNVNQITPEDLRDVAQEFVKRMAVTIPINLVAGPQDVEHGLGGVPSHVTFMQYLPDLDRTVPISALDWWAEDATAASKIIVNAPEAMLNMKIKFTL